MEVIEENMTVVDVDVEAFREALDSTFDQFGGELWPEGTLETIEQLAAEHADAG